MRFRLIQLRVEGERAQDLGHFAMIRVVESQAGQSHVGKFVTVSVLEGDVWRFQVDSHAGTEERKRSSN